VIPSEDVVELWVVAELEALDVSARDAAEKRLGLGGGDRLAVSLGVDSEN
jgi:hypothetical protein